MVCKIRGTEDLSLECMAVLLLFVFDLCALKSQNEVRSVLIAIVVRSRYVELLTPHWTICNETGNHPRVAM